MVGGGAVGASTAYHLAKIGAGAGVLLLEVSFEEGTDKEKDKVKDNTWLRSGRGRDVTFGGEHKGSLQSLNGREHIERLNQLVATPNHLNPMTKIIAGASYRGRNSECGDTLAFWRNGNKKMQ